MHQCSVFTSWACLLYIITTISPEVTVLITSTVCLSEYAKAKAAAAETSFRASCGNYRTKEIASSFDCPSA